MFEKIDLEKVLRGGKEYNHIDLIDLQSFYNNDEQRSYAILKNIFTKGGSVANFELYDKENIFSEEQIKALCIKYNLRFLDSSMYKGIIPGAALNKIKMLEDTTYQELENFKIIAPARRFELEDENADPLLFANLGNKQYLFIHKWGNDLKWYNKLLSIPVKSYDNLGITTVIIALLISLVIPTDWLTSVESIGYFNFYRALFFLYMTVIMLAFTTFIWFSFRKGVSSDSWNKKTD